MENKAHALAAGVFMVALIALLLAMGAWLTRDTGARDTYEITTDRIVTGLQEQAPVRYRGVDIGKVSKITFDPKKQGNVLLRLSVDREAPITRSTYATLSFQGVTGLAFVQLDDDGKDPVRLVQNDEVPPRIPLRPGLLAKLEERGEVILDRVQQITEQLARVLNEDNQKKLATALTNIGQAADSATKLATSIDATVQKRLDPALAEATTTMRSVRSSSDEIGRTAADFGRTARRLNEKDGPIDQLAEGTQALSHAAESFNAATLPRINRVTEETSRAVRQLGRAVNNINDSPQSLIFGTGTIQPGPGEPGFKPPAGAQQ
jgi:phospholipid/cholesterol/gamma-HCH transport system substrate-binding protein